MNKTIKFSSILVCLSLMMLFSSCRKTENPSQESLQEETSLEALQQEIY